MQNFEGQTKSIMGNVEMANTRPMDLSTLAPALTLRSGLPIQRPSRLRTREVTCNMHFQQFVLQRDS